jgi:hypothetical protein
VDVAADNEEDGIFFHAACGTRILAYDEGRDFIKFVDGHVMTVDFQLVAGLRACTTQHNCEA